MRWEYLDPPTPRDERRRAQLLAAIDQWWAAFADHAAAIDAHFRRGAELDVPGFMDRYLHAVDPRLMWEFGPAVRGPGHRLVITPEVHHTLRPMLRMLLEMAPALPGWELYPYRLADPADVLDMIEARTGSRADGLRGRATRGEDHLIDLSFACPERDDLKQLGHAAFVAAETLLGEEALDKWVGAIEAVPHDSGEWLGIEELRARFLRLQAEIVAGLPDKLHAELGNDVGWTGLKVRYEKAPDYPRQTDLYVASTMNVDLWRATRSRTNFCSSRFSRLGETFCYLKLDGKEGIEAEKFPDKLSIEEALEAVLAPAGLGGCVGSGSGFRYSYLDYALTDVRAAAAQIRRVLREGRVPRKSWLLFFDAELQDEWIGIWDDTPPPPTDER